MLRPGPGSQQIHCSPREAAHRLICYIMSSFTCCFKATSETHSVQQIHQFLLGWRRNSVAPGDTHTSVVTAPALPEAMVPGLYSVPDEAQTSSSKPSQQERNPQALESVRGLRGFLLCVRACVRGAHACASVRRSAYHDGCCARVLAEPGSAVPWPTAP